MVRSLYLVCVFSNAINGFLNADRAPKMAMTGRSSYKHSDNWWDCQRQYREGQRKFSWQIEREENLCDVGPKKFDPWTNGRPSTDLIFLRVYAYRFLQHQRHLDKWMDSRGSNCILNLLFEKGDTARASSLWILCIRTTDLPLCVACEALFSR